MKLYKKLEEYWTLTPPRILEHKDKWNGVTITPIQQEKKRKNQTKKLHKPKRKITRTFGDILTDEVKI